MAKLFVIYTRFYSRIVKAEQHIIL